MIPNCEYCSDSVTCTYCFGGYYVDPGNAANCLLCSASISNCVQCYNGSICTLCKPTFALTPLGQCVCTPGLMPVTNECTAVVGCTSAIRIQSTTICISCNASASFVFYNNSCPCVYGFQRLPGNYFCS